MSDIDLAIQKQLIFKTAAWDATPSTKSDEYKDQIPCILNWLIDNKRQLGKKWEKSTSPIDWKNFNRMTKK